MVGFLFKHELGIDIVPLFISLFQIAVMCFKVAADEEHPRGAQIETYAHCTFIRYHVVHHADWGHIILNVVDVWRQLFPRNYKQGCRSQRYGIYQNIFMVVAAFTMIFSWSFTILIEITHDFSVKFRLAWQDHWLSNRPLCFLGTNDVEIVVDDILLKQLLKEVISWATSVHVPSRGHDFNMLKINFCSADVFHQLVDFLLMLFFNLNCWVVDFFNGIFPTIYRRSLISIQTFELLVQKMLNFLTLLKRTIFIELSVDINARHGRTTQWPILKGWVFVACVTLTVYIVHIWTDSVANVLHLWCSAISGALSLSLSRSLKWIWAIEGPLHSICILYLCVAGRPPW